MVLERKEKKNQEETDFNAARVQAKEDNMQIGIETIAKFDLSKKETFQKIADNT